MAHNLEIINGEAQMFSVRQVPWHKLGKILDAPPTSAEAIQEAGLDWDVELKDIYWKEGESYVQVPKKKTLVRTSDNKPLSVVSQNYKPLQNKEAFEWFDTFVKEGQATYETAGSIGEGKKIWILAKLKDSMEVVKGDEVRQNILLCNGHDGVTSILLQPTGIRVVCENTLAMSLGTGLVQGIWHHGDVKRKMAKVKQLFGLAKETFGMRKEVYKAMTKTSVDSIKIGTYVKSLIPDANKEATDRIKRSVQVARERIWDLHETGYGANIPGVRGTVWGVYNAAVEYGDYDMPKKVRNMGNYQLFGQGAQFKKRAYNKAVELMEA